MGNIIIKTAKELIEQIQNGASESDVIQILNDYNEALRQCNVSEQNEQLVCPNCKQPFTKEELEVKEHCFNCGWEFTN